MPLGKLIINKEILAGFKKDISKWKVQRFIKSETEYDNVYKIVEEYVVYLKTVYIVLISNSNFPAITWNDFISFVNSWKLLDDYLSLSAVDRLFIATKSGGTQDLNNFPERDLSRFEFYEIIVRMAACKYKDSGRWKTYALAVKTLIEDDLMTQFSIDKWEHWREKELWTLEINDILYANSEALKKIHKSFLLPNKRYMDLNDAIDLLIRRTGLFQAEKEIIHCFGMWKITVVNEILNRKDYNSLSLVEFYEFIPRIAEVFYKTGRYKLKESGESGFPVNNLESIEELNPETEVNQSINTDSLLGSSPQKIEWNISLASKIGNILNFNSIEIFLDAFFPAFNLKRKEVKIEIEFESDTSED